MAALRSSGTGMPSSSTSGLRVGTTSSGINATAIQGTFSSRPRGQSYPIVIDDEEDATTRCHPLESRAVAIGKRPFEEMADETAKLKDDNDSELEEFDQELLLLGQKHLAEIRARKAGQDDASTRTTSIGPSGDSASEIKARRLDGHVEHDTRQTFKSDLPSGNNVENGVEVESSPAPLNLVTKKSIKATTAGSRVPFGVITDDELNRLAGKRPVGRPSNKDAASRKALLKKIMGSGQSLYVDKSADAPDNSSTKRVTRSTSSDSSMTVPPAESSCKNPVSLSSDATNSADGKPTLQKTRTASSK